MCLVARIICFLYFSVHCVSTFGQEDLPRILILGDSVYQQPSNEIAKALKGKAKVVYSRIEPGHVWNSTYALAHLDEIVGQDDWDLIHFNVGLGDLICCLPHSKSFRVLPPNAGGIRATSAKDYEKNLEKLTVRLKSKCSHLIWASTTPIRHSATGVFVKGSEVEYNRIADGIMKRHGVPINDMFSSVSQAIDMNKPASHGADPFFFDRKPIHEPLLKIVSQRFALDVN